MANAAKYIWYAVGAAVVAFLVWLVVYIERRTDGGTDEVVRVVVQRDTVRMVVRDTVRVVRTVPQELHHYDTIVRSDTVYIADKPQLYTESTNEYRLQVQAVKMYDYSLELYRVDSLTTITEKVRETAEKRRSRAKWGQSVTIGLQVGYGLGVQPTTMRASFEPYVGIGITYGFGVTW